LPAKKKATRKPAAKSAAKSAAKPGSFKFGKATKPRTKGEIYNGLADNLGMTRKQVSGVFDCLTSMVAQDLKNGPEIFTFPGLAKITVVRKPATKARKGINPFTGEEMMFKAKPARNVVKLRALKNLKAMV